MGFPRLGSHVFLTHPVARPAPEAHRYESWRALAEALGLELPARESLSVPFERRPGRVLVHSGAAQPVRVWPLDRYASLVRRMRQQHFAVRIACDPDQRGWWLQAGEPEVAVPRSATELLALMDESAAFIGNDSGPAHLAALCGVPTFTIFGPQLPEWFAPLHPASECLEGKPCPYKPCSDYCRFPVPFCLFNTGEDEVWHNVRRFLNAVLPQPALAVA